MDNKYERFIRSDKKLYDRFLRWWDDITRIAIIHKTKHIYYASEVAKMLRVSPQTIKMRAEKLGIEKRMHRWAFNDEEIEKLRNYIKERYEH